MENKNVSKGKTPVACGVTTHVLFYIQSIQVDAPTHFFYNLQTCNQCVVSISWRGERRKSRVSFGVEITKNKIKIPTTKGKTGCFVQCRHVVLLFLNYNCVDETK